MILLALSSTLKWAWAIGLGTHYSNIADRPEHLNRAPTHTIQRWKGTYTMAFISNSDPIKFPNFPESSCSSQPSLYCLSLSFVVQKVVLCRSNLCVDCVCWVVLAGWWSQAGTYNDWGMLTGLEQLQAGRTGACGDALLILLALCSEMK